MHTSGRDLDEWVSTIQREKPRGIKAAQVTHVLYIHNTEGPGNLANLAIRVTGVH